MRVRFIATCLATAGCAALVVAVPQSADKPSAALDRQLSAAVERKDVPGVVAIATDRRRVIYQGAFGMADTGHARPMTADAIFRIASMTKAITSVALMQLVEQGRVSLDDPASTYLPELARPMVFDFGEGSGARPSFGSSLRRYGS